MDQGEVSGWESQKDLIKDELSTALRELSKAETGLGGDETSIKRAIVELLSVRNRVLGVLQEDPPEALLELNEECENDDIDLIMRSAYLAEEYESIGVAKYIAQRYREVVLGLLNYLESEKCSPPEDEPLPEDMEDIYHDIGFVSYEHSSSEVQEVLKKLQSLDIVFRFDNHSLLKRKIYAFDFIFLLEKLRTIFAHICTREELESYDLRISKIFKAAFLWGINDVGELVMDLLEYGKSEQMSMMVARLIDMSRKIIDYCGSQNVSALEGTFIGIDDMSELEPDFDD